MKCLRKFINSLMSEVEPLNLEKLVSWSASTGADPHSPIIVFRVWKDAPLQPPAKVHLLKKKDCQVTSNKLGCQKLELDTWGRGKDLRLRRTEKSKQRSLPRIWQKYQRVQIRCVCHTLWTASSASIPKSDEARSRAYQWTPLNTCHPWGSAFFSPFFLFFFFDDTSHCQQSWLINGCLITSAARSKGAVKQYAGAVRAALSARTHAPAVSDIGRLRSQDSALNVSSGREWRMECDKAR